MENKVYIEIHNTYLLLVILKKQKLEFLLDRKTTQIVPLNNLEFDDGIVNNPTVVSRFIRNYIDSHNIKKPEAVICLRNADKTKEDLQKFMTLQVSLAVAKAGLTINKIVHGPLMPWTSSSMLKGKISKSDLNNKSNLFKLFTPPKYTNPQTWIALSFLIIATSSTFMFKIYTNKRGEVLKLETALHALSQENDKLSKNTQKAKDLKAAYNHNLAQIAKPNTNSHIYGDLLELFSKKIPATSWLTSCKKFPDGKLEIIGNTIKNTDVSLMIKNFDGVGFISDLTLASLNINNKDPRVYTFTIHGRLNT